MATPSGKLDFECQNLCDPYDPCPDCEEYWQRMKNEGYWIDGKGWTDKAKKEWIK